MRVRVNGKDRDLGSEMTVGGLVASYNLNPKHVAVEVNCELVPRRTYDVTLLREGDRVEIVTLVGGG
ncbi:MAG: sulfur carrier protein ThiS [Phycisphaerae bacterium]|nr:sulfur carrier protein ThiS [Phycisphaerae bacterium]